MRGQKRAFTLIELLVVIAIIAVLVAMLAPVLAAVKSAALQAVAGRAASQVYLATNLYMADHDDTFPPAMYLFGDGQWLTWFGRQTGEAEFDISQGIIGPYRAKANFRDPTHQYAQNYLGDQSGFGYNYGFIGSDFHITGNYQNFPVCENPARSTEISQPSTTVIFATSSFFKAPWLAGGDGLTYDFGFIDPPDYWAGNPNVDFRHFGKRKVVEGENVVRNEGRAIVLHADGNIRVRRESQIEPDSFRRTVR
ncbi:MAG: type II secretion system protein [Fimbriimonadaceae bacterium]